jgi:DNA-binding MarR family transcriptional regulator
MQIGPASLNISQTLVEGFRVLQAFTATEPTLTLGEVADRTGLDSGTAFHLVQTLVILGYVERIAGSKQFRLTLKPLELGFHALAQNPETFSSHLGIDKDAQSLNKCSHSELIENNCSQSENMNKRSNPYGWKVERAQVAAGRAQSQKHGAVPGQGIPGPAGLHRRRT